MMRLHKTDDGMFGVESKGKITFYNNMHDTIIAAWNCYPRKEYDRDFSPFLEEIHYATETMAKKRHNIADFGVIGCFIFSKREVESEF